MTPTRPMGTLHWTDNGEPCGAVVLIKSRHPAQKALFSSVPFPQALSTEKPHRPCPGTYWAPRVNSCCFAWRPTTWLVGGQ